jgi:hypothetical protein
MNHIIDFKQKSNMALLVSGIVFGQRFFSLASGWVIVHISYIILSFAVQQKSQINFKYHVLCQTKLLINKMNVLV